MSFELELGYIKNYTINNIVLDSIKIIPDYFYKIPASSSGKYHPMYALGEGGLYRHVKATIVIANDLFNMDRFKFSQNHKDLIIGSLILHDGWKQGMNPSGNTLHEHPNIAAYNIFHTIKSNALTHLYYKILICLNIKSHMGQWTTSKYSSVKLMKPHTKMQKFVHLCDYLASRRDIEIVL